MLLYRYHWEPHKLNTFELYKQSFMVLYSRREMIIQIRNFIEILSMLKINSGITLIASYLKYILVSGRAPNYNKD